MNQTPSDEAARGKSDLRLRLVSGIVLCVLVLAVTVIGGLAFRIFAAALAVLVLIEWMAMRPAAGSVQRAVAWAAFLLFIAAVLLDVSAAYVVVVLGAAVLIALTHGIFAGNSAWIALGMAYAGLPAVALAFTRGDDARGLVAILFLFAVVWATDVTAYFSGRAFGGPRLAPSISPGKTWSGALGGAIGAVLAGAAVAWLASPSISLLWLCLLALLLSAVSQIGDLFESALKRRHGVKDSGRLIPGHGGVMDRVDGLVAAAVLFYLLGGALSGFEAPAAGFFSR